MDPLTNDFVHTTLDRFIISVLGENLILRHIHITSEVIMFKRNGVINSSATETGCKVVKLL